MAYVMTFTSLKVDMRRYLERGFTEESDPLVYDQIPRLINMAERRIAHELKLQGFINAVSTPLVPGVAVYKKPDRWRETVSMTLGGTPLTTRSYEYLRNFWPVESETGSPLFYADYDYSHWLITPTPAVAGSLEVLFYQMPRLLDDENETNWLTEFAPNILLYGALLEATPYVKNDERVPLWQATYDRAAQALSGEDMKKVMDRSAMRDSA